MERMIGDLLDLTRARLGGTIPLRRRQADLQALCEEVVAEAAPRGRTQTCGFTRPGAWSEIGDPDRLAQVVSNLVANAIQHGDGTPVTLALEERGNTVMLPVHNDGPPIPADVLPSIFEPLARGGGDGGLHNIGLGLFIARAMVLAHGGEIGVDSSSDQGTTFTARLPKFEATDRPASDAHTR